jgi:hypothetical protein
MLHPQEDNRDTVRVFLGNGDGSFQPAIQVAAKVMGGSVGEGDFNRDGIPDLAMLNHEIHSVQVLLGNGDGSFKLANTFRTGGFPGSVSVGDFNRDGILDLAVFDNSRREARSRSQHIAQLNPGLPSTGPSEPRIVLGNTQGALVENLESAAGKVDMAAAEAKTPRESSKGSDSLGILGQEEIIGLPPLPAFADHGAETDLQEHATGFLPGQRDPSSSPAGQLLAGLLPIDLAGLERKVDEFFHQIDNLAEDATEPGTLARLTPWLATGAVLATAYAVARRHLSRPAPNGGIAEADGSQSEWSGLSGDAFLPPWERS